MMCMIVLDKRQGSLCSVGLSLKTNNYQHILGVPLFSLSIISFMHTLIDFVSFSNFFVYFIEIVKKYLQPSW